MKNDFDCFVEFYRTVIGKKVVLLGMLFLSFSVSAQSDLDRILKGGELVIGGLSIFKILNSDPDKEDTKTALLKDSVAKPVSTSKTVSRFCIKNKLSKKIILKLKGKDEEENEIEKELIVQDNDKECLFEIPKGIWSYEIVLEEEEAVYKKGEYNLIEDEMMIVIKEE